MNHQINSCFVFGSNESGHHGAGAARAAYEKHGARWGMSYGYSSKKDGNGILVHSFAIPTKDQAIHKTLNMRRIKGYVQGFLSYAYGHPEITFDITRIGCGLAGLQDEPMAALFEDCPSNCRFDSAWEKFLTPAHRYWGTF